MDKVIVLESSTVLSNLLKDAIKKELSLEAVLLKSLQSAKEIVLKDRNGIVAAVTGLVLEDATRGESLEFFSRLMIPFIVWSSSSDWKSKFSELDRNAIAYVLKSPECIGQVVNILRKIIENRFKAILIVDDNDLMRRKMVSILSSLRIKIFDTRTAEEGLSILDKENSVRVIITDYVLGGMDGLEFLSKIRQSYPFYEKTVIGLSSLEDEDLSLRFLMYGANDFIKKPFHDKELLWRVLLNFEMIELVEKIKATALNDVLTGLPNRRAFFDRSEELFSKGFGERTIWLSILDVDHFKSINDTYGHAAGDVALKMVSSIIKKHFDGAIIAARIGGEEFGILGYGADAIEALEAFRNDVAQQKIKFLNNEICLTVSAGVSINFQSKKTFQEMLTEADGLLYQAKREGRNQIRTSEKWC
ncbi:MAG: diguanylate cyclase [Chthoniobacterales bacterium]|nr:diguanylate cyclase [Chthoniobacterales bacterium]